MDIVGATIGRPCKGIHRIRRTPMRNRNILRRRALSERPYIFLRNISGGFVGAIMDRPAVKCYEFAETQCEYENYPARALSERPYIFLRNISGGFVGAIMDRPAVKCYEFAETQCEYENYPARALTERPYFQNRNRSINCNLTMWKKEPFRWAWRNCSW